MVGVMVLWIIVVKWVYSGMLLVMSVWLNSSVIVMLKFVCFRYRFYLKCCVSGVCVVYNVVVVSSYVGMSYVCCGECSVMLSVSSSGGMSVIVRLMLCVFGVVFV